MNLRVSDPTEELIASLYESHSLEHRVIPFDSEIDAIGKIGSAGEPGAIADLLPIVVTRSRKAAEAATLAIDRLLQRLDCRDYAQIDEFARQTYSNWHPRREPWFSIKPADVTYLADFREASVSLLGMASCHGNGHVREAAVRQLAKIESGAELPFLLLRANDWVLQIRPLTRDLLATRIRLEYARHYLKWLPLVLRLGQVQRDDHSQMVESILRLLQSTEAWPVVEEGLRSPVLTIRRFAFETALKADRPERGRVLRDALAQSDPLIRFAATNVLRALPPCDESLAVLDSARNNSLAAIRCVVLRMFAEKYPGHAEQEFLAALLDPNASVREAGQGFKFAERSTDLRSFYRAAIGSSKGAKIIGAILGLGERGSAGDAALILPFASDARPRVRQSALRALARLDSSRNVGVFLSALEDKSAGVAREASLGLSRLASLVGGERLWEIFERCEFVHGRRAALFLLARLGKWDSIVFLVKALGDANESLVALSKRYITRWLTRYNRTFTAPTNKQVAALRRCLLRYDLLVGRDLKRELESMLKSFERA